jgi:hypothetical protein
LHRPFIMTLIVIAGVAAVPTLACAENPPAAMDSCVAAFMTSILKQTSAIKLRESDHLNNGLVNASAVGTDDDGQRCTRPSPGCACALQGRFAGQSRRAASGLRERVVAALIQRRAADAPYPREGSP